MEVESTSFCVPLKITGKVLFWATLAFASVVNTHAATFTVSNTNDGGMGSFRQAVIDANNNPGDDIVAFQIGLTGTIVLTTGEIVVSSNVAISGPGADVLSVSGNSASRVIRVSANSVVSIAGLTISQGGGVTTGGGILNAGTLSINRSRIVDSNLSAGGNGGSGAGIANEVTGTLDISLSTISNNTLPGALTISTVGGGVDNRGVLNVVQSTIFSNAARTGGGIYNSGTATLKNCTLYANRTPSSSTGIGGGIYSSGTLTLESTTIASNNASNQSGGGGVSIQSGTASFLNTIVANNTISSLGTPSDVRGSATSQGYNLIGNANGSSGWLGTDLLNQDARLTPLGSYGGFTQTVALLPVSPAINSGQNSNLDRDQRGSARVVEGTIDIGSYERNINVSPTTLPNGVAGTAYSQTISASRVPNPIQIVNVDSGSPYSIFPPFSFTLFDGALPSGIVLSSNGTLSGTPAAIGSFPFTIKIVDSDGMTEFVDYSLVVTCGSYLLDQTNQSFTATGGTGSVSVSAAAGCTWSAVSNDAFIVVTSGGSGNGNGITNFTVQSNTGPARVGSISIAGQTVTVNQASGCTFDLSSSGLNAPTSGLNGNFGVSTSAGCSWTATSNQGWLSVISGTGNGNGSVSFSVAPNTGATRVGTIITAGQTFTVTQAPLCTFSLSSSGTTFNPIGGSGSFNVTAFDGCAWNATSDSAWLTINTGSGNGNGSVSYSVSPNVQPQRTGVITVGNQTFNVIQNSGCSFALSSSSASIPANGGIGSFDINTGAGCNWTAQSKSAWVTIISGSSGSGSGMIQYSVGPNTGGFRSSTITAGGQSFSINQAPQIKTVFELDGDQKTDLAIFRPNGASSEWWLQRSANGSVFATQFGATTDTIVPADYTGDGKTDVAFWRPSTGNWFVLRSEDLTFFAAPFGANGDTPVPADYDADGKADVGVFRPTDNTWYIQRSSDNGTTIQQFGTTGDVPVNADYDGDGKADIAIYRPSLGQWWLSRSTAGTIAYTFGSSTDKTVAGDYTGDGKADVAFWRPSTGEWFILRSEDSSFFGFPFGTTGDTPVPGDYDGDGRNDAGVFRSSNSTWYINRTTAGTLIQQFGTTGDMPLPNAYVR